jgi:hypothetical protein
MGGFHYLSENLGTSRLIPTGPVYLTFWQKFRELQVRFMLAISSMHRHGAHL